MGGFRKGNVFCAANKLGPANIFYTSNNSPFQQLKHTPLKVVTVDVTHLSMLLA